MSYGASGFLLTEKGHCLSAFKDVLQQDQSDPSWLLAVRQSAKNYFTQLDFPNTRDEEWKYTNVAPLLTVPFLTPEKKADHLTNQVIQPFIFGQPQWARLVFVNGLFSKELSSVPHRQNGFRMGSLQEAMLKDAHLIEPHLGRYLRFDQNPFHALNTAFFQDGAFIYLPEGKVFETPIHLIFISTGQGNILSQPRNLFIAGRGAQATLVESHVALEGSVYPHTKPGRSDDIASGSGSTGNRLESSDKVQAGFGVGVNFTNAMMEMVLGEEAVLDYYKIQSEGMKAFHVATTEVRLHSMSNFSTFSLAQGARLSRFDLNTVFVGEGAQCVLKGLYMLKDEQHADHHIWVDHARPNGSSQQFYKGILDGKSTAVFNGRVIVRKDAQGTNAHQTNKNLLLSEEALVDTKPQLEIFANDVKCTHGAAIGQLDEEAVFYLKSRGISETTARHLLIYGFANELINRIKLNPIRLTLDGQFLSRFQRESRHQEVLT